jgi:hypothetical protein
MGLGTPQPAGGVSGLGGRGRSSAPFAGDDASAALGTVELLRLYGRMSAGTLASTDEPRRVPRALPCGGSAAPLVPCRPSRAHATPCHAGRPHPNPSEPHPYALRRRSSLGEARSSATDTAAASRLMMGWVGGGESSQPQQLTEAVETGGDESLQPWLTGEGVEGITIMI